MKDMKMQPIGLVLLFLLVTMLSTMTPLSVSAGGALDGKTFTAFLDGEDDVLTFQDSTFHSLSCDEWGFGTGEYTTEEQGDSISFEVKTTSENDGSLVWKGTVRGDTIKGSYLWTKKGWFGTKTKTKNFEGTIKN